MNGDTVGVVVVVGGCCVWPLLCLLTGMFAGYRIAVNKTSPVGLKRTTGKVKSGKFAVED